MGWFRRKDPDEEYRTGLASPSGWLINALGASSDSYSGKRVTTTDALSLGAVFSAVEKISEAIGTLPLKVFRIMDDGDRIEARNHRTWRMLHDQPNPVTSAHRFWSTVAAQMLLWGNAYIYKERSRDALEEVESLWLLDPAEVVVNWNGRVKSFTLPGPPQKTFSLDEVLHIPAFSLDGIYGCSRITYCRQTLGTALARAEFEGSFYRQGARIPGVLEHPGRLGKDGIKNLAESFSRWHGGSGDKHKVPVLEEGMHFNGISMPMQDMQFIESQRLSLTEIAIIFNLPPAYLGGTTGDSLTYATTESNQIQFAQLAIVPLTNAIAKALSGDPAILPWNVMYAEFVLEGLLRADMKTRAEYWEKMKAVLNLDPAFIASRENIPKDALKPEPKPIAGNGTAPIPPAMAQMQNALKSSSGT